MSLVTGTTGVDEHPAGRAALAFERVASNFAAVLAVVRARLRELGLGEQGDERAGEAGRALWLWTVHLESIIDQLDAVVGLLRPGSAYAAE